MVNKAINILMDYDLRLRPASIEDVGYANPWYSDPEVLKGSEGTKNTYDPDRIEKMYRYLLGSGEFYIIEIGENKAWKPIGDACLMPHSLPIVIGDPNYRSKGYGKRVLLLLIARARSIGWKKMKVKGIFSYNERSIKMFLSCGFILTGQRNNDNGVIEYSYSLDLGDI